jgi:hypothetical protein
MAGYWRGGVDVDVDIFRLIGKQKPESITCVAITSKHRGWNDDKSVECSRYERITAGGLQDGSRGPASSSLAGMKLHDRDNDIPSRCARWASLLG